MIDSIKKCLFFMISSTILKRSLLMIERIINVYKRKLRFFRFIWRSKTFNLKTTIQVVFRSFARRGESRYWGRQAWYTGTGNGGNGSVYEKLQLLPNLAVIGVLFRWFYGYLLILGFSHFLVGVSRKGTRISQLTILCISSTLVKVPDIMIHS